ncbi:hypothetical protein DSECCO2_561680 [anaerobic digester metagenome]
MLSETVKAAVGGAVINTVLQLAENPAFTLVVLLVNNRNMDPEFAVTGAGTVVPLNCPSKTPVASVPS